MGRLLAATFGFFDLLFSARLYALQLVCPEPFVILHPFVNGPKPNAIQFIHALPSRAALAYQSYFSEDAQVLGNLRLRPAKRFHKVIHRSLAESQGVEQQPPFRLGDGVEGIESGWSSRHGEIVFLHRNMSIG